MNIEIKNKSYILLSLIINENEFKIFKSIKNKKNIQNIITLIGKGTVNKGLFANNQKKFLVKTLIDEEKKDELLNYITEKLKLHKKGHGIAYTVPINTIKNDIYYDYIADGKENNMFVKLTIIVNRGQAEDVMDIARDAGANGGTILHGRGTGIDCQKLFGMEIEPEKEVVIIIIKKDILDVVVNRVSDELNLDDTHGILFVEPLLDVIGIVEVL